MVLDTRLSILEGMKKTELREEALAQFDRAYRPTILAWCRASNLQEADAEDVTQAILIKLSDALRRFDYDPDKGKFRNWLATVVRNAVADRFRPKNDPEPHGTGGSTAQEMMQQIIAPENVDKLSSDIESRTNTAELEAVARVKARVEPKSWEAFFLLTVEKWPGRQVAERLSMNVASVYKARQRVNEMIKTTYQEIGGGRPGTSGVCP